MESNEKSRELLLLVAFFFVHYGKRAVFYNFVSLSQTQKAGETCEWYKEAT